MNETTYATVQSEPIPEKAYGYLSFIYRPMMKAQTVDLFRSLAALGQMKSRMSLADLFQFCGMQEAQFHSLRKELEQFHLLKTYEQEDTGELLLSVQPPLQPREFFQHDIFSRCFLSRTSESYFQRIKNLYDLNTDVSDMKNITEFMRADVLNDLWTEEKEQIHQKKKPILNRNPYPFDWNLFFKGMQRTLPDRLRTESAKAHIATLAGIYCMDEEQMRKHVSRFVDPAKTSIDFDALEKHLQFTKHIAPDKNDGLDKYQQSPVNFLRSLQKNHSVILPDEKDLVKRLVMEYGFAYEVVNTLMEYCMNQCDMAIIESYILPVANTWARNNISTREQALEYIKAKENGASKTKPARADGSTLPEWYKQTEETPASPELLAKALAVQKELFGSNAEDEKKEEKQRNAI